MNEEYRPTQNTEFENLWVGGAHTKTSVNIWSMESAVESGKLVSNLILKKYKKPLCDIYIHKSNKILENIKKIDDILYKLYLPNILDIVLLIILVLILQLFNR